MAWTPPPLARPVDKEWTPPPTARPVDTAWIPPPSARLVSPEEQPGLLVRAKDKYKEMRTPQGFQYEIPPLMPTFGKWVMDTARIHGITPAEVIRKYAPPQETQAPLAEQAMYAGPASFVRGLTGGLSELGPQPEWRGDISWPARGIGAVSELAGWMAGPGKLLGPLMGRIPGLRAAALPVTVKTAAKVLPARMIAAGGMGAGYEAVRGGAEAIKERKLPEAGTLAEKMAKTGALWAAFSAIHGFGELGTNEIRAWRINTAKPTITKVFTDAERAELPSQVRAIVTDTPAMRPITQKLFVSGKSLTMEEATALHDAFIRVQTAPPVPPVATPPRAIAAPTAPPLVPQVPLQAPSVPQAAKEAVPAAIPPPIAPTTAAVPGIHPETLKLMQERAAAREAVKPEVPKPFAKKPTPPPQPERPSAKPFEKKAALAKPTPEEIYEAGAEKPEGIWKSSERKYKTASDAKLQAVLGSDRLAKELGLAGSWELETRIVKNPTGSGYIYEYKAKSIEAGAEAPEAVTPPATMLRGRKGEKGEVLIIRPSDLNRVVSEHITEPIAQAVEKRLPSGLKQPMTITPETRKSFLKWRNTIAQGDVQTENLLEELSTGLGKLSKPEQDAVFLALVGDKPIESLPERLRPTSKHARNWIREIGQSMGQEREALGMPIREAWMKGERGWFPRIWTKHATKVAAQRWYGFGRKVFSLTKGERGHSMAQESSLYTVRGPGGKTLRGGIFETQVDADAFLAKAQKKYPGYKFRIQPPKSWEELIQKRLLEPAPESISRGFGEQVRAISKTRLLTEIQREAERAGLFSEEPIENFVPFSSTRIQVGKIDYTKNPALEKLVKGHIHPSLAAELTSVIGPQGAVAKILGMAGEPVMRFMVTAGYPYRWIRSYPENILTVGVADAPVLADPRFWKRVGWYHGGIRGPLANEIKARGIPEETLAAHVGGEGGMGAGLPGKAGKVMEWVRQKYGMIDLAFKAGLYDYYKTVRGKTGDTAYQLMEDATFNFRDMPRWVKSLGRGIPFRPGVFYNFARTMATQMRKQPVTFTLKAGLLVGAFLAERGHQVKKLQVAPQEEKMLNYTAIPLFRNDAGRLVILDVGWLIPFGDLARLPEKAEEVPAFALSLTPMIGRPLFAGVMLRNQWGYPMKLEGLSGFRDIATQMAKEIGEGYAVGMARLPIQALKEKQKEPAAQRSTKELLVISPATGIRTLDAPEYQETMAKKRLKARIRELKILMKRATPEQKEKYRRTLEQIKKEKREEL